MYDDNNDGGLQEWSTVRQWEQSMENTPKVYAAIAQVVASLAKEGISKARDNKQQGYKFRGIDDVYNALSPFLSAAGLCVIPKYTERTVAERETKAGGALFYVTVIGQYDLVCVADGSRVTVGPFYGEAMDSGDKATNKAMSASFKYMAMQTFVIPTEGDNDADATTHEVKAKSGPTPEQVEIVRQELHDAALNGIKALKTAWEGQGEAFKDALRNELPALKAAAATCEPEHQKAA